MRFNLILLPLLLAGCAGTVATPPSARLFSQANGVTPRKATTLIVVLHGDTAPGAPVETGAFAPTLAAAIPDSAVVSLLRPGYADVAGNRSPGMRGAGTGDDYTSDRIAMVADAIATLKGRYRAARVIALGEGGGAAIAANLAGLRPGLLDGMVLVSCPCALPEWRRNRGWKDKVDSLDPLQTAGGIAPRLRVAILTGADDRAVLPRYSRSYAEALSLRGITTDFRILPGKRSGILNEPDVIDATKRLAAALPRTSK